MTQAAIAAEVHQTLDVDADFTTKIALDHQRAIAASADLLDHALSVAVFWQAS